MRPARDQALDHERAQRLGTGEVQGADGAGAGVLDGSGEHGIGKDGVGEASEVHDVRVYDPAAAAYSEAAAYTSST